MSQKGKTILLVIVVFIIGALVEDLIQLAGGSIFYPLNYLSPQASTTSFSFQPNNEQLNQGSTDPIGSNEGFGFTGTDTALENTGNASPGNTLEIGSGPNFGQGSVGNDLSGTTDDVTGVTNGTFFIDDNTSFATGDDTTLINDTLNSTIGDNSFLSNLPGDDIAGGDGDTGGDGDGDTGGGTGGTGGGTNRNPFIAIVKGQGSTGQTEASEVLYENGCLLISNIKDRSGGDEGFAANAWEYYPPDKTYYADFEVHVKNKCGTSKIKEFKLNFHPEFAADNGKLSFGNFSTNWDTIGAGTSDMTIYYSYKKDYHHYLNGGLGKNDSVDFTIRVVTAQEPAPNTTAIAVADPNVDSDGLHPGSSAARLYLLSGAGTARPNLHFAAPYIIGNYFDSARLQNQTSFSYKIANSGSRDFEGNLKIKLSSNNKNYVFRNNENEIIVDLGSLKLRKGTSLNCNDRSFTTEQRWSLCTVYWNGKADPADGVVTITLDPNNTADETNEDDNILYIPLEAHTSLNPNSGPAQAN